MRSLTLSFVLAGLMAFQQAHAQDTINLATSTALSSIPQETAQPDLAMDNLMLRILGQSIRAIPVNTIPDDLKDGNSESTGDGNDASVQGSNNAASSEDATASESTPTGEEPVNVSNVAVRAVTSKKAGKVAAGSSTASTAPINPAPVNQAPVNQAPVNQAPVNQAPNIPSGASKANAMLNGGSGATPTFVPHPPTFPAKKRSHIEGRDHHNLARKLQNIKGRSVDIDLLMAAQKALADETTDDGQAASIEDTQQTAESTQATADNEEGQNAVAELGNDAQEESADQVGSDVVEKRAHHNLVQERQFIKGRLLDLDRVTSFQKRSSEKASADVTDEVPEELVASLDARALPKNATVSLDSVPKVAPAKAKPSSSPQAKKVKEEKAPKHVDPKMGDGPKPKKAAPVIVASPDAPSSKEGAPLQPVSKEEAQVDYSVPIESNLPDLKVGVAKVNGPASIPSTVVIPTSVNREMIQSILNGNRATPTFVPHPPTFVKMIKRAV